MKKSLIIKLLIIIFFIETIIIYSISINKNIKNEVKIDEKYECIAIFKGESLQNINTTYLLVKKDKKNYKYKYINTIILLNKDEQVEIKEEIIKKDKIKKIEKIFEVAKNNNAYSYVKNNEDNKIYTIDEYKNIITNKDKEKNAK